LGDGGAAADVRMRANANELVNRAERADDRPFFHRDMSGESGPIYQHGVIADYRIVANMRIRHDQRVIPDASHTAALYRAPVQGYIFAHHVVVADLQASRFAVVADVLRVETNRTEWKELVIRAYIRGPLDI